MGISTLLINTPVLIVVNILESITQKIQGSNIKRDANNNCDMRYR